MAFPFVKDCVSKPVCRLTSRCFQEESKVGRYIAVGVVVAYGTFKIVNYVKRQNRRQKWNNVGKDVVVLHMFPRGRFCPNLSPFAVKLETYLKMAQIRYEVDFDEPTGPKGKCPWITLNGEEIGDSQLIIEKLSLMYNKDLTSHLTSEQKAVGAALRIMSEDHLLWCLGIWRYVTDNCRAFIQSIKLPFIFLFVLHGIKGKVKRVTYLQGMGRHSEREVEEFGRKDLLALSNWLGDKAFIMGEQPSEVDCAVFGVLSQIQWNSSGSPYLRMIEGDFKNLSAYCFRVKEKFWPDWTQCLDP